MENFINAYSVSFLDKLSDTGIELDVDNKVLSSDGSLCIYPVQTPPEVDSYLGSMNNFAVNNYPNEMSTPGGSAVQVVLADERVKSFKGVSVNIAFSFFTENDKDLLLIRILGGKVYFENEEVYADTLLRISELVLERDGESIEWSIPSLEDEEGEED